MAHAGVETSKQRISGPGASAGAGGNCRGGMSLLIVSKGEHSELFRSARECAKIAKGSATAERALPQRCHPERTREGSGSGRLTQMLREYAQHDRTNVRLVTDSCTRR